jgi:acetyl esterase/lipase
VGWLVDHAEETGIDADHIAVLGHSAGAGIVASLATDPAYLETVGMVPTDLGCVAPLDTEAFSIEVAVATGPELSEVYTSAFGTDPAGWAELSPLTHVGQAAVPDLFLVTRGAAERRQLVATFRDAVEGAGGLVTIVDLPAFTHEDVNQRIGDPSDSQLTPALESFLTACLTG